MLCWVPCHDLPASAGRVARGYQAATVLMEATTRIGLEGGRGILVRIGLESKILQLRWDDRPAQPRVALPSAIWACS